MIKDEKDPYISKQLENKLRALCSRVTDVSDTKITFEDLIGEIEKKKNSNISLLRKNILQRNRHNGINNDYYYG